MEMYSIEKTGDKWHGGAARESWKEDAVSEWLGDATGHVTGWE